MTAVCSPPRPASFTPAEGLLDPNLLGAHPAFADAKTWWPWVAFARASYGQPLDTRELALFKQCTGRTTYDPPVGGWRESVVIVGRQAGKTRLAAALGVMEAALAPRTQDSATYVLLVAQDARSATRALFGYAQNFFSEIPMLGTMLESETADTLTLSNRVSVAVLPCRPAACRGVRAQAVIVDELAFFLSTEGRPVDKEMLRAVRPCLATTGGRLMILSSPYGQSGALYDLHRKHFGRDDSPILIWQASAPTMNPTLPADYLTRMAEDDPEAYRSEVLGEFRSGIANLFDSDTLDACVVRGRRELPPVPGASYMAFTDPAGGSGKDAFTLAVSHRDTAGNAILDCVRAWKPPFNPSGVIAEAAGVLKSYWISRVTGDRYAGEFPREHFRANGIHYECSTLDRSQIYLETLPIVNAGRVELLDLPELLRELRGLERKRGSSGRDRVDHRTGAHDDLCNSALGALLLAGKTINNFRVW